MRCLRREMINIAHFGSYNVNVGDNIALLNIRKGIESLVNSTINWNSVDIKDFHDSPLGMNSIEYAKLRMRNICLLYTSDAADE